MFLRNKHGQGFTIHPPNTVYKLWNIDFLYLLIIQYIISNNSEEQEKSLCDKSGSL